MENSKFNVRFTAILLALSAIMVNAGYLMRPVQLQDAFNLASLLTAHENQTIFIWSFRVLVFGVFLGIMGLFSWGSLMRSSSAHPIINPGVIVCSLALFVGTTAEAYFMHMGAWAGWKASTLAAAEQEPFVKTLEVTYEWVLCLRRMGYMFFCLGFLPTGIGIIRDTFFPKWLGYYAVAFGVTGITVMLIYDSSTAFYEYVRYAYTLFFAIIAVLLWNK